MYKLVSPIENGRWSFCGGYNIFNFAVFLSDKDEIRKYKLIDDKGKEVKINIEDCLVEE